MYSTCIFCHSPLGANEAIEHFPVGRRLAFDAAKGRLWAVCRKCERWNLTPLEERWEAIEECERSFRETKLRISTAQIGLGRLREGLELVRIGKPLRPEFAAWRYGDQFGRRRRKNIVRIGAVTVAVGAMPFVGATIGASIGLAGVNIYPLFQWAAILYDRTRVVARVRDENGRVLIIRTPDAVETVMLPPTAYHEWGLRVTHRAHPENRVPWWQYTGGDAQTDIRGAAAMRAAAQLLPRLNRQGATKSELEEAVKIATEHEDPTIPFEKAARFARRSWIHYGKGAMLTLVPTEIRLALEMISHEDAERRAMEGELALLEDAWREAEEIAGIADDMFLPAEVSQRLAEIKAAAPLTPKTRE